MSAWWRKKQDDAPEEISGDPATRRREALRCAWTTSGRRCHMVGVASPSIVGGRAYCTLHAEAERGIKTPWTSTGFEEWLQVERAGFPVSTYGETDLSRHAAADLWAAVNGHQPLPVRSRAPEDRGNDTRELWRLAFGPGPGGGIVRRVVDGETTLDAAIAEIHAATPRAESRESELFG